MCCLQAARLWAKHAGIEFGCVMENILRNITHRRPRRRTCVRLVGSAAGFRVTGIKREKGSKRREKEMGGGGGGGVKNKDRVGGYKRTCVQGKL